MSKDMIINNIVQSLYGIGLLFKSAIIIADFLEVNFPFTGKFYYRLDLGEYEKTDEVAYYPHVEKDDIMPGFYVVTEPDFIFMTVGLGIHSLDLRYEVNTGELDDVTPDDIPGGPWVSLSEFNRKEQVFAINDVFQSIPREKFLKIRESLRNSLDYV